MSEIQVRLPDGKTLTLAKGSSLLTVAEQIGPGLARAAIAGRVDGELRDLRAPIDADAAIEIVTRKDPAAGEVIRHSAEHVMADAVKRLFPTAQVDVGRTDHAEKFQYDFLVERPFTPEDLERIEKEMGKIISEKSLFERQEVSRSEALAFFQEKGEELKVSRLGDIPEGETVTLFRHGDFVDLCRGPHVQRTDQIGAFKLLEVAGSYWRGDETNPMLQRIYGTAFVDKKELAAHLERAEEAKRRDHRRIGPHLDLFHLDAISPGSPYWHPPGMVLYNELVDYIRTLYLDYGFDEVMTPQVFNTDLYKTSGHYENFKEDMFLFADDENELAIKPMNCPGHAELFKMRRRSYRELPIRFAEFSRLHRNERSGSLSGLTRVRSFAQDDAHIFCSEDQVEQELSRFFRMMREVYDALGLKDVKIAVSTRGEKFIGRVEDWDLAEKRLVEACRDAGFEPTIKPGDAAFYAPKVEADFTDVIGRVWTLGTVQIDMGMPERFDLSFISAEDREVRPQMIHRAVLGSLERFIAIYLEHTEGNFPLWLAPQQVVVLPITERHSEYAGKVVGALRAARVRAELDDRNEKLGFKIREAELRKVPVMAVVGDQEQTDATVAPRRHRSQEKPAGSLPIDEFVAGLVDEIARRRG